MVSEENRTGLYIAIPLYFALLGCVAYWGYIRTTSLKHKSDALSAHYLGGRSFGPLMSAGTLFASQFSGYTVVGIPNEAFATGWVSLRWIATGIGVIFGYAITAHRLRKCSLMRNHQSPVDFITDRFRSQLLRYTILLLQLVSSTIYLSAQVIAVKTTFNSIFEVDPDSPVAVIIIFFLILVFEWTGGLVSVAATDGIQGLVMVAAFLVIPFVITRNFGGWAELDPLTFPKPKLYQTPSKETQWLMWNFAMVNIGFFSLPHMVQRIYAAKDLNSLKFAYAATAVGGFLAWLPAIFLGTMGIQILADAGVEKPASPYAAIMEEIMNLGGFGYFVGVMGFTAALAAIMSTADSIIIAISQLVVGELVYPFIPDATPVKVTWIGRFVSFMAVVIGLLIGIFWSKGLSDLAKVQFGISLQCVPAFFIGLFSWGRMECHPWSVAAGGLSGFIITMSLYFGYVKDNDDAHPMDTGVVAVFSNCVLVFVIEVVRRLVTGTLFSNPGVDEVERLTNKEKEIRGEYGDDISGQKTEIRGGDDGEVFTNRPEWDKPKLSRFGERPLSSRLIWKSMKGTWEPFTNPALLFLMFFLATIIIPFSPPSMPPLDEDGVFLYMPSTVRGIPYWALWMIALSTVAYVVLLVTIFCLPGQYADAVLDPDTIDLLPHEMDKRMSYDHTNERANLRRSSVQQSLRAIAANEQHTIDHEHRSQLMQILVGESVPAGGVINEEGEGTEMEGNVTAGVDFRPERQSM